MQGHRRRSVNYYQCAARRRPAEFVPEAHPKMVFVREAPLMEKVLEFLQTRVFGPERRELLLEALSGQDAEGGHTEELRRLESELGVLNTKIRRQVANLESEELGTDLAREIRRRAEELIGLRAKKTPDLAAAQRAAAEHPTPETAQSLLGALPLLAIDWRLL